MPAVSQPTIIASGMGHEPGPCPTQVQDLLLPVTIVEVGHDIELPGKHDLGAERVAITHMDVMFEQQVAALPYTCVFIAHSQT